MSSKKVLFSIFVGVCSFSLVRAEPPANAMTEAPVTQSYVGEAAEAVVGRVFGVEGDASDIKYHVFELTHHSPVNAAARSLFVPGWGQHFNNQTAKGSILFITTVGALLGSIKLYDKSNDTHHEYESQGLKSSGLYDDYENERISALALGGVAAVLWTVGVMDAYKNAYSPLYSKNPSVDVAFGDDGARVVVRKNF